MNTATALEACILEAVDTWQQDMVSSWCDAYAIGYALVQRGLVDARRPAAVACALEELVRAGVLEAQERPPRDGPPDVRRRRAG